MRRIAPLITLLASAAGLTAEDTVVLRRVPEGGIQPQVAVGSRGEVHLVYYRGEAGAGDLFWVRSDDRGESFSSPVRVNSKAGSAIAAGTIRGAQIALGRGDRVHVAWNGSASDKAKGAPFLYSRLDDKGASFEPQRNVMTRTVSLDGGGSVAADGRGNVYCVWHASEEKGPRDEGQRAVWVSRSSDEGRTFHPEVRANKRDTGACGCCGLRAFASRDGKLYVLYRTATRVLARDMHLLVSGDNAKSFEGSRVDSWNVPKCVMSLASFAPAPQGVLGAWETREEVYFGLLDSKPGSVPARIKAQGVGRNRKHPTIAVNSKGQVLLAWTEGTGWKRGGSLAWQLYDEKGGSIASESGRVAGVPVWSFPAAFATPGGSFVILY